MLNRTDEKDSVHRNVARPRELRPRAAFFAFRPDLHAHRNGVSVRRTPLTAIDGILLTRFHDVSSLAYRIRQCSGRGPEPLSIENWNQPPGFKSAARACSTPASKLISVDVQRTDLLLR